jgi:hypothetical protein
VLAKDGQKAHWSANVIGIEIAEAVRSRDFAALENQLKNADKKTINHALLYACRTGNLETTKFLIKRGGSPGFVGSISPSVGSESLIMVAVQSGESKLIDFLLELKGTLHKNSSGEIEELTSAAARGDYETTQKILLIESNGKHLSRNICAAVYAQINFGHIKDAERLLVKWRAQIDADFWRKLEDSLSDERRKKQREVLAKLKSSFETGEDSGR